MDDFGNLSEDEQRVEAAKAVLDALDPELVRELLEPHLADAIATLVELSESDDPTIREQARSFLDRRGIG